ncbi:hypothetical protein ACFQ1I_22180 [Kitasatospora arboriphila]
MSSECAIAAADTRSSRVTGPQPAFARSALVSAVTSAANCAALPVGAEPAGCFAAAAGAFDAFALFAAEAEALAAAEAEADTDGEADGEAVPAEGEADAGADPAAEGAGAGANCTEAAAALPEPPEPPEDARVYAAEQASTSAAAPATATTRRLPPARRRDRRRAARPRLPEPSWSAGCGGRWNGVVGSSFILAAPWADSRRCSCRRPGRPRHGGAITEKDSGGSHTRIPVIRSVRPGLRPVGAVA